MSIPTKAQRLADARLRIAVFNRIFEPTGGGAERYSIALVEHLAQQHEIHVFAQAVGHVIPGVTFHLVPTLFKKPRWLNQLWYATATWWLTRRNFDVVHSHENTWHGQLQTLHVLPVKYNLFHGHGNSPLRGLRYGLRCLKVLTSPRLLTYLALESTRLRLRPGRKIVVASPSLGAIVAKAYPRSAHMLTVITPGVVVPTLPSNEEARQVQQRTARSQLGLPVDGLGILLVGNDYRKKGLATLLKALAQMDLVSQPVWLAVVGSPVQIPLWQAEAAVLGIGGRVHFLGPLHKVDLAYQAVDVLAHPTLEDTFAMVVLEAMSFGLPVVVSGERWCGISSLLTAGDQALVLSDPEDVVELKAALMRLLGDPELRHQLGTAARAFAQLHGWTNKALEQESLYRSALG
jgi:glycosyltransferase involved in cell wall biosynthesis